MAPLPLGFYARPDVVAIAQELIGKLVCSRTDDGHFTVGRIVETEAYAGTTDRASHAYNGRRTARTEVMFGPPGVAYVYLVYGMYHLLNVVTHSPGVPHAVLIRALEPTEGLATMLQRRRLARPERRLTGGPGLLTQALGITVATHNGASLTGPDLWLADAPAVSEADIVASPRVGVAYAAEDALLPYRFRLRGSAWTSPAR